MKGNKDGKGKRDQVLAFVGDLPEWFDDLGDFMIWGDCIVITHPHYSAHKYDFEDPAQGWMPIYLVETKRAESMRT
jgi:hypothetical protein